MAFKLKGGVGGPFRKNYPSAFKHPSSDPSEHPHKPRTHDGYESRYESIQARKKDPAAYDKHKADNTQKKGALFTDVQSVQSALTGLEFVEGPVGMVAGATNAVISGGRGVYHSLRGESEQAQGNYTDAALSVGGIVPILGNYATALKVGKNTSKALTGVGYYGRARHIDDVPDVVTGGATSYGNLLSFEVDAAKVAAEKSSSFKMGNKPLPGIAREGSINKKHRFKVERANLEDGVLGEAKMDGSIQVDNGVEPGSAQDKKIIAHESVHAEEIASGKIEYGDDYVRDGNSTFHRKDGKIKYNGKWYEEGSSVFPWEKRAMKAENNV